MNIDYWGCEYAVRCMTSFNVVSDVSSKGFIMFTAGPSAEEVDMSQNMPIKALESVLNDVISIKLKDQRIFRGRLTRCDMYMNLTLSDAEELEKDEIRAKYGQLLLRGNNILWIQIPE